MKPIALMIILHYHVFVNEMDEVRRAVPSYVEAMDWLQANGLMEPNTGMPFFTEEQAKVRLSEKGKFFLNHLLSTPLPQIHYVMPDRSS